MRLIVPEETKHTLNPLLKCAPNSSIRFCCKKGHYVGEGVLVHHPVRKHIERTCPVCFADEWLEMVYPNTLQELMAIEDVPGWICANCRAACYTEANREELPDDGRSGCCGTTVVFYDNILSLWCMKCSAPYFYGEDELENEEFPDCKDCKVPLIDMSYNTVV